MKLLYCRQSGCDEQTLKRLLLVGTELVFMDRPSVTFGGRWGTIGHQSPFRALDTRGEPVTVTVCAPPSGPAAGLYEPYAEADFKNAEFCRTFQEGLRCDRVFASKFIQPEANYGDGLKGQAILDALRCNTDLTPLPLAQEGDSRRMFKVETSEDLRTILKMLMADASIQLTSALVVAEEANATPVANDPYFLQLLSARTSGARYVGGSAPHAWLIGLEFAKSVIPDEVLQRLSIKEVITYRRKTKELYEAWTAHLNEIAAKIDHLEFEEARERIPKLKATELEPQIIAYRTEMASVRDSLFAGLLKGIADWKAPTLTVASFTALGFGAALAAFASSLVGTTARPVVDFFAARRSTSRKHAVSYLIGLTK
jgi:hypothetical protein